LTSNNLGSQLGVLVTQAPCKSNKGKNGALTYNPVATFYEERGEVQLYGTKYGLRAFVRNV
jgi:hypothetical protein